MIPDPHSDFWPGLSRWLNAALRNSSDNAVRHLATTDVYSDVAHSSPDCTILAATALVTDGTQFRYSLHIHLGTRLKNVKESDWDQFLSAEPMVDRLLVDKDRRTMSIPTFAWL